MITLTELNVRRILDPLAVIAAIEHAFRDRYPTTSIPIRTQMPLGDDIFLMMPCYDGGGRALGMKLVLVKGNAKARPAPDAEVHKNDRIQATYLLLDPETARPRLTMPANYLTDLRTAATSAVATKFLAREDAKTLGIFGTGRQARAHLKVLPLVRRFQLVLISSKTSQDAATRAFAEEIAGDLNVPVEATDANTCAANADVICTCTTSPTPLFDGQSLRPGTHLNLVGAFQPHTREADSITLQRARVFVESTLAALTEAGDLLIPMQQNEIPRTHIVADLHELISGKKVGRRGREDITVFKSVGCALEDLVTAELVAMLI